MESEGESGLIREFEALRSESWLDPRLEVRPSPISGKGMFAREALDEGELIIIWGGRLLTMEDVRMGRAKPDSLSGFAEDVYLGQLVEEPDSLDQYLNHSCDPNLWLIDEVSLATRRTVNADEELTADYALWEIDTSWSLSVICRCRSPLCRGQITGFDWLLPDLQERYCGHFTPCINERIRRLSGGQQRET